MLENVILVPLISMNFNDINPADGCGCGATNGCGSGGCLCGSANGGGDGECGDDKPKV